MNNISVIGLRCVGCRSCVQSCPKSCISFIPNEEGFFYPSVDESQCVECGKCLLHCPESKDRDNREAIGYFAFKERDREALFSSASGGVSDALVAAFLEKGDVAFGASFDENFRVHHIAVLDQKARNDIQSSKYVQSNTEDSFSKTKEYLDSGKKVLYTGTPCQIAGLYSFLGKEYDNLFTVDIICHGVPSPLFFSKYINYQEKKLGEKIEYYNFRSKDKRGWGTQYLTKTKTKTKTLTLDKYGYHFMNGDCYRESCYICRYANLNRPGDITAGDFWGAAKASLEISTKEGVSSVVVNSQKGNYLINLLEERGIVLPLTLNNVLEKQNNLRRPTPRNSERDSFYRNIHDDNFIERIHIGHQLKERIKTLMPREIIEILKKMQAGK